MRTKMLALLSLTTLVLSLAPAAHAQTFSVIHIFTGTGGDGARPQAGVTLRGGVLFGTTQFGGNGQGTVYQIRHVGSNWIYTPIFIFPSDGSGGANPTARVVYGPDGHLYGTAHSGGSSNGGVVFNLTPPLSICRTANCSWKENVLYSFVGGSSDGAIPGYGDLVWDQQGSIYGTTIYGGGANSGTVYRVTKSGNSWTETPIYSFSGYDGQYPEGGVIFESTGKLIGTTTSDTNDSPFGVAFELTYMPGTGWKETSRREFVGSPQEGQWPEASLVGDSAGNFYGTTPEGGNINSGGTAFRLSPSGDTWTLTTLYNFSSDGGINCGPAAPLTMDGAGNLYGTSVGGGRCGSRYGNVFELINFGNGSFGYYPLHEFNGDDGAFPTSPVTIDASGTLYGVTATGGPNNQGVVWMIKP